MSAWLVTLMAVAALGMVGRRERRTRVAVARASHELRGPLAAARLALHGLAGDGARLAAIDLELRRAGLALEDLTAGPRRPERPPVTVDLATLLKEAQAGWSVLAATHGAALDVRARGPVRVRADPLRLAQACGNLVANAVEHGGGTVHVRLRVAGEQARVEIADGGAGLPVSLEVLLASARGRRSRRGHGLAIAAAIARSHGGRLSTAPSAAGARLVLELPCLP